MHDVTTRGSCSTHRSFVPPFTDERVVSVSACGCERECGRTWLVWGGLLAAGGLLRDWLGELAVLTDIGLLLSEDGLGEEQLGGRCLEGGGAARPEAPGLMLLADGPVSRAL